MTAMSEPPDSERSLTLARARWWAVASANALTDGTTELRHLAAYKRWITVLRLLGEISEDDAEDSISRANTLYSRNVANAHSRIQPMRPRPA